MTAQCLEVLQEGTPCSAYRVLFEELAMLAEYRLDATGHVLRVSTYAAALARGLGVDETTAERISVASVLHDVGKVAIPRELLLKPGPLTKEERRCMEQHTFAGYDLIDRWEKGFCAHVPDAPLFAWAKSIAKSHHESLDGSGYPEGLAGDAIPWVARIVKVADVLDALQSPRTYKPAWTWEQTMAYVSRVSGTELDEQVVGVVRRHPTWFRRGVL